MLRKLRAVAVLGLLWGAGCGGAGTGEEGDAVVCTGTLRGAATADISFCSLSAQGMPDGQLVYTLQFDTPDGAAIDGTTVTFMGTGTPRTGSVTFTQALGDLQGRDGGDYQLAVGMGAGSTGSATLSVDSVPAGRSVSTSTLYEWFGGEAQLTFRGISGTQGEVQVSLDFVPQS